MRRSTEPLGTNKLAVDLVKVRAAHAAPVDMDQYLPNTGPAIRQVVFAKGR